MVTGCERDGTSLENKGTQAHVVLVKVCKYDSSHRCFHPSCGYIDNFGRVHVCRHHGNPRGRDTPRKVVFNG